MIRMFDFVTAESRQESYFATWRLEAWYRSLLQLIPRDGEGYGAAKGIYCNKAPPDNACSY